MKHEALFKHTHSAAFGAVLFLAFVLAGAAYIIWAKLANVFAIYVTGVPLALMILYTLTLLLARYFRLRDDQAGDNLYYLGFLYTLTSLGVSLWQFSVGDGGETIVTNFGVAIATTILGVALRVVFNQMRQDPIEVEHTARLELADAARRVKQELDATSFEFSSFRRATQQILEETVRETRATAERVACEIFDSIKEFPDRTAAPIKSASAQSKETIDKLAGDLIKRLENTGEQLTAQERTLAKSTAAVATSAAELEARLKEMQNPDGIIEIKLQPFIRNFTKAIKDQSEATAKQMAELQKVISQFDQSVRQMSEQMVASARERAADQKESRDLAAKAQADSAETKRLLTELEKKISANPAANGGRVEPPRRWPFGGGS